MLRLPTENDTRKVVSLSPILVTWQSTQGRKECHEKGQNKNIFPKAMPRIVTGLKFRPLSRQASHLGDKISAAVTEKCDARECAFTDVQLNWILE